MLVQDNECMEPLVTNEEFREVCGKIDDNKTPSLDGIHNRALKLIVKIKSELFGVKSKRS